MTTGIAEFDQPFSQSAQASKMLTALQRRGVAVVDDAARHPANTSAQVFRENGNLTLVYDSKSTSFVDLLHESRHVAQVQLAEASGLLGNKDIFGNSRLVGAAERGAYEYEMRLGKSRGFSSEYMNYLSSQKEFYYPSSFAAKFNASPTMGGIFKAIEPGLKP